VTLALLTPRGMLRTRHERHAPLHCALFEPPPEESDKKQGHKPQQQDDA